MYGSEEHYAVADLRKVADFRRVGRIAEPFGIVTIELVGGSGIIGDIKSIGSILRYFVSRIAAVAHQSFYEIGHRGYIRMTEVCRHGICLGGRECCRNLLIGQGIGRIIIARNIRGDIRRCDGASCLGIGSAIGVHQFVSKHIIAIGIQRNGNIAAIQRDVLLRITIAIIEICHINITNASCAVHGESTDDRGHRLRIGIQIKCGSFDYIS